MATALGTIQNMEGKFYAQDTNGNVRVLKIGDEIHQGEKVFGDAANSANNLLEIVSNTQETFNLRGSESFVFDMSTNEATFGNEEVAFSPDASWLPANNAEVPVEGEAVAQTNAGDITEEETAAGTEIVRPNDNGVLGFENRDGNATNIASDLRSAIFPDNTPEPEDNGSLLNNNAEITTSTPTTTLTPPTTPETTSDTVTLTKNETTSSTTEVLTQKVITVTTNANYTAEEATVTKTEKLTTVETDTKIFTAYAYEGDGYSSFESNGNLQSAQATVSFDNGLGVSSQNGKDNGKGQSTSMEENESLLIDFGKEINSVEFLINKDEGETLTGQYIVYDENRNILFTSNSLEEELPNTIQGFRYIVFDAHKNGESSVGNLNGFHINITDVDGKDIAGFSFANNTATTSITTYKDENGIEVTDFTGYNLVDGVYTKTTTETKTIYKDLQGNIIEDISNYDTTNTTTETKTIYEDANGVKVTDFTDYKIVDGVYTKTTTATTATYTNSQNGDETSEIPVIDLGDGTDTLKVDFGNNNAIDFTELATKISNAEMVDFTDNESQTISLSLRDVFDITDANNTIQIDGDSNDKVSLEGTWAKGTTENGYTEYTGTTADDETVKVKISDQIDII